MKRLLQSKRPSGSSELDFFLQEVWDAIMVYGRIVNQPGKLIVEYKDFGIVLTPLVSGAGATAEPHPFKIVPTDDWLTFIVKSGKVITLTTGTEVTPTNVDTEITVTSGVARYWFYVNISGATPAIEHSATLPSWSETIVPVGYVVTTDTVNSISEIGLQMIHDNIYSPCV